MPHLRPRPNAVNLPCRVVFLHIAKTAGTSIVHFFRRRLPERAVCSHGDFLDFPEQDGAFQQSLRRHQFVSGHFGYADVASLLPDSYSFTFLRDPVDRVLSLYKFCLHADMQRRFAVARAAGGLGLEGFIHSTLPEVCEMLDNQQTWQLARGYWMRDRRALAHLTMDDLLDLAWDHLNRFSHIGLTQTFDRDFRAILADLDIREPVPARRQLQTPEPLSREALDPETLSVLQERVALDCRLLDRVRALRPAT
jgi:hypothetical protein